MRSVLWLVVRELSRRRLRIALALGATAAAVALCVGTELVMRAREDAVAGQIDRSGPPLHVVPTGVGGAALARLELGRLRLPAGLAERVRGALGPALRDLEERLVVEGVVGGVPGPIVGVPHGARAALEPLGSLGNAEVALGSVLAGRTGTAQGAEFQVERRTFRVAAVLPSTGSADDWPPLCRGRRRRNLPVRGVRRTTCGSSSA